MLSRSEQEGAALVLTIAIAGVAALAWQHRSSLSQLIIGQQVLDQSVQAASLAAAQHHARLLNAHAYLNRTVMAHQVAMAHLITIASAEKMRLEMSRQVTRGNPPLYLIGMMFGPHHAAAYAASRMSVAGSTDRGLRMLHEAFATHDRLLAGDLQTARRQLLSQVNGDTYQLVREVLQKNIGKYPSNSVALDIQIQFSGEALKPKALSGSDPTWKQWFDAVIKAHPYLSKRRDTARNWWVISKGCPHMRHELRRRGESTFDAQGLWQATDTLSFHAVRGHKIWLCFWREYPMGWANVTSELANRKEMSAHDRIYGREGAAPPNFRKVNFLDWIAAQYSITAVLYGFNNVLADGRGYATHVQWRAHHRVKPYELKGSQSFTTTVTVKQPLASLRDPALKLGLRIKGLLKAQDNWPQYLTARAAAQTYYDRYEPRSDRREERANLYQPFWLAKNILVK